MDGQDIVGALAVPLCIVPKMSSRFIQQQQIKHSTPIFRCRHAGGSLSFGELGLLRHK